MGNLYSSMNRIFLVSLFLPLFAWAQPNAAAPFNPDFDGNGCYAVHDLTALLCMFGTCGVIDPEAAPGFQPYHGGDSCYSAFDLLPFLAMLGTCDEDAESWSCGDPLPYGGHDYGTVLIAGQCWFSENLRSTVHTNGDPVEEVVDASEWAGLSTGAMVVYGAGNEPCSELSPLDACDEMVALEAFGRMYNGFAVADPRGLCPTGWHVGTDADWTALEGALATLGFEGQEGVALKTATGWYNGGNGQDAVGFSAVPGGYRFRNNGLFLDAGASSYIWTSTDSGGELWYRYLNNGLLGMPRNSGDMRSGFSVRCVLD